MPEGMEHLNELIGLAGGLPAEQRRVLLHELTNLFLENEGAFTAHERETLGAVINQIAATLAEDDVLHIAAQASSALAQVLNVRRATMAKTDHPPCEEQLIGLLRAGQRDEFLACFAQAAGITPEEARRALNDESGALLAAACRAAGFERSAYSAIVLLAEPLKSLPAEKTEALLQLYAPAPASQVTHQAA